MERSSLVVRWLPGADRLARAHREAGQQLDHLCGVHWGSILLASDGFPINAETLALHAGTLLPQGAQHDSVPYGDGPRRDYRLPIPVATRSEESGTSVQGLAEAVAEVSGGARTLVPLRTAWSGERVIDVLRLCREQPAWGAVPLANVQTGRFWGWRLPLGEALAWLAGTEVEGPAPDWEVGHFVTIAGILEGPARSFLIVRDSYPSFGWDGHHLQPPEAMAAALRRDDGREGGIALYVAASDRADVERAAKEAGFQIGEWNNGTPWHEDHNEGGTGR